MTLFIIVLCFKIDKLLLYRKYLNDGWCVEEFLQAHVEALQGRNKFIIMILVDNIEMNQLPEEMQVYVKAKQFIDARNIQTVKDIEKIRKRILFAMPRVPIRQLQTDRLKEMNFMPLFHRLNNYDKYNEEHEPGQHNVPVFIDSDDEELDDYRDSEDDENDNTTTEGESEHLNLMDEHERRHRPEEDVEAIVHMEDEDDDEGEDSQLIQENSI